MRTRTGLILSLLLVALLIGSACTERSSDSADVPIWTIDATPLLEITDDDPDGEVVLGNAVHVTRRPDGGLMVSDQGLHSLRLFSSDGRFQRAVGRQGAGPGEFEFIRQALRCGDSLFVEDIVTRRVTVHSLDGTIARTMSTLEFAGGPEAFRSACNADGVFVHHAWNQFDPTVRGRRRTPLSVWITSAARDLRVALADVDGPESVGFGTGAANALLRRTPQLGIGRRHVYVGAADSGVVQVYALDGTPAGTRRLPESEMRATAADLERAKRIDSLGQDAETQKETRRVWELDTPPATLPAYDAILVDKDEHLWVRRYPVAGKDSTPWIVFNPAGVQLATVTMPAALTVYEVGPDYVSGIVRDPVSGRHAVVVLSLNRFPARSGIKASRRTVQ